MKLSELIETLQEVLETSGDGEVSTLVNKKERYLWNWIYRGWVFIEKEHDDYLQPTVQIRFKPQGETNEVYI